MLAKQIRRRMKNYVFPPELLENLTDNAREHFARA
jgi:hypothetical protein